MSALAPYIANTDKAWFDYLASISVGGRLDEVNFWSPKSPRRLKHMRPGHPVFFRLKKPDHAIAGYGFFAHFAVLDLHQAWTMFAEKNGDPSELRFLERIGRHRGLNLLDLRQARDPLACTILRDAMFWEPSRWIPWSVAQGWSHQSVRGKGEDDAARASRLLSEIEYDHLRPPEDFAATFEPLEMDERQIVQARSIRREGQGAFRSRLLDAYGRRCAITGERTEPVLDAAHIQDYLGPRSNHVQNGLLLCKELHALFDIGMITVTPEYRVSVSPRLHAQWKNGRRYYQFDGKELSKLPDASPDRPSVKALIWHNQRRFLA